MGRAEQFVPEPGRRGRQAVSGMQPKGVDRHASVWSACDLSPLCSRTFSPPDCRSMDFTGINQSAAEAPHSKCWRSRLSSAASHTQDRQPPQTSVKALEPQLLRHAEHRMGRAEQSVSEPGRRGRQAVSRRQPKSVDRHASVWSACDLSPLCPCAFCSTDRRSVDFAGVKQIAAEALHSPAKAGLRNFAGFSPSVGLIGFLPCSKP